MVFSENEMLDNLKNMPIEEFTNVIKTLLQYLGITNIQLESNNIENIITGSGAIELPVLSYQYVFLIERIELSDINSSKKIRSLLLPNTNKGLLISLGNFSREAKKDAKKKGAIPIDLINGKALVSRLQTMFENRVKL